MNAARKGPRADSRAYRALARLHKDGGQAHILTWMKSMGWHVTRREFEMTIVDPLLRFQLLCRRDAQLVLTDAGAAFFGVAVDASASEPVITPATYVAPMRPLSPRFRQPVRVLREGAFDYRGIPSLQAGERTEYQSSLRVDHG